MLAQTTATLLDNVASFGAAGLMGAMWLWERRNSTEREKQIDAAHQRIMADGVKIESLIVLIERTTEALTRLIASHDGLVRKMEEKK